MPEPLNRKDKHGVPYVRRPEVEAWLARLEIMQGAERIQLFAVATKSSPDYVPSEALVYFLRDAWRRGENGDFERIFKLLMKRVEQSLRSAIPDSRMTDARGIRTEIMGCFAERIAKDCRGRDGLLDFYEVMFDKAFVAIRTSTLRRIGPRSVDTCPMTMEDGNGVEIFPEVETAAADFLDGDPSMLDDPAFRLELTAAIDALAKDQKRVIGLLQQGFQIDSKDPKVMTIARILKCDERTVRNRRDRACKELKKALLEDTL